MPCSKSCRKLINSTSSSSHEALVPLSPPTLRDAFTHTAPSRSTRILFVALSGLAADLLVVRLMREGGGGGKRGELKGYEMVVVVVLVVVAVAGGGGGERGV